MSDARWGQTPKVSKRANTGGGDDDGVAGHGAAGDTDRIERVYLDGDHAYRFTHDYNGRYWRAEWWAQVPISKRGAQLRDTPTASDAMRSTSADKGGPATPSRSPGRPSQTRRVTKAEVAGLWNEKVAETLGNTIAQLRADPARVSRN